MKKYWIIFCMVTFIGLAGFGMIIFKCFIQSPQPEVFYLNIDSMRSAVGVDVDSSDNGLQATSMFLCHKINISSEVAPWADLYVCKSFNRADSLSGDTALVLIDVQTRSDLDDIEPADHYAAHIKMGRKFNKIKVMVPAGQIDYIRNCRYKFGHVTLVYDWVVD